jgi:NAD-dependent DNA ligase
MNIDSFLDYASKKYYEGTPIISDEEFDALAEQYKYATVGHSIKDGVPHLFRMYSLQKVYQGEDETPLSEYNVIGSKKLDGAAVSLTYVQGKLLRILTRGDGINGQDVSHLIPTFPAPKLLKVSGIVQIDGELAAPKDIQNARNYASGALSLKSAEEFLTRDLTFVAYSVQPYITSTYQEDQNYLAELGFETVLYSNLEKFPTDGEVFRINKHNDFDNLGFTAHHPRGAYALKTRKAGIITTLLGVVWQVGKSGVVSPVAILDPIEIGGALVSKATLHNIKYITELGLEIGCQVEVIRSGEIIPRVVRRV